MAALTNPFKPIAGKTPPELIGRNEIVEEFSDGLTNGPGAPGRLLRITGIRGMGKTVMLNELGAIAERQGWIVVHETASGPFAQRVLRKLDRGAIAGGTVAPEFMGVKLGSIELEREQNSLRDLMTRAANRGKGLLITLDEVQDAAIEEIRELAVAVQHLIREDANVSFVFAGLASMVEGIVNSEALTFLRRAIPFVLGPLPTYEIADSLYDTMRDSGMQTDPDVIDTLAQATAGYPFMVQLVGYYAWQNAFRKGSAVVRIDDAERGISTARRRFDETVIEPALHHMPPMQVRYLLAMCQDEGASSTGEVARRMGRSPSEAGVYRVRLINSGILDAGAWGKVRFAIPYLGEYLRRHATQIEQELGADGA